MKKIPNLFNSTELIISQGLHSQRWGTLLGRVSIDFSTVQDLICPFDGCEVKTYENSWNMGKDSYFTITLPDGSMIICVHGSPIRTGIFNKDETIGKCTWHHWHISMLVEGKLACILDYIDRSIPMRTDSNPDLYGTPNHPDGKWASYPDKFLKITTMNEKDENKKEFTSEMLNAWRANVDIYLRDRGFDLSQISPKIIEQSESGRFDIAGQGLATIILDFVYERKETAKYILELEKQLKDKKD
jgi:hypothetical protein